MLQSRPITTNIYRPPGMCRFTSVAAPVAPALTPCAARAAAVEATSVPAVAVVGADSAHKFHHHHMEPQQQVVETSTVSSGYAVAPGVRKDCGFPWWVLLALLGLLLAGLLWLWLKHKRATAPVVPVPVPAPVPSPRPVGPVSPVAPVSPSMGPVSPVPASPALVGGSPYWSSSSAVGSPALGAAPQSPSYSPVVIGNGGESPSNTAAGPNYCQRPYGMVELGVATQVSGEQVSMDHAEGNPALVMYTSKGCTFCDQALPEIQKAAAALNVPVLVVDREDLPPHMRPYGYPQIHCITGPNTTVQYRGGERVATSFIDFVRQTLGPHWIRPGGLYGY